MLCEQLIPRGDDLKVRRPPISPPALRAEEEIPAAGPSDRSEPLLSLTGSANRRRSFEAAFKEEREGRNSRGRGKAFPWAPPTPSAFPVGRPPPGISPTPADPRAAEFLLNNLPAAENSELRGGLGEEEQAVGCNQPQLAAGSIKPLQGTREGGLAGAGDGGWSPSPGGQRCRHLLARPPSLLLETFTKEPFK